jgi:hypothetical protein
MLLLFCRSNRTRVRVGLERQPREQPDFIRLAAQQRCAPPCWTKICWLVRLGGGQCSVACDRVNVAAGVILVRCFGRPRSDYVAGEPAG